MGRRDCKLLYEFLKSQRLMSLATTDGFNLWSSCIKFVSDRNLNIYFVSGNYTKHVRNIMQNSKVSMSVVDIQKTFNGEKLFFQARGFCGKLGKLNSEKILDRWNKKFTDKTMSVEDLGKNDSSIFKAVLTKVKYVDTSLAEKVIEFDF